MKKPIEQLNQWLTAERDAGAPNPQQAILATATKEAIPHSRVVAIREVNEQGLLFFTQRGTRKVSEIHHNPIASMTFWFELLLREVIIEGMVEALSDVENEQYWQTYPREAQVRFYSYAPTSTQPIVSKQQLEDKRQQVEDAYDGKPLPMSDFYCGFRLKPSKFVFYAYQSKQLSDVIEYACIDGAWRATMLSP